MALPRHLQGVVVAEVPVEHQVGQRDNPGDPFQQGVEHACDARQLWCESHVGFGVVSAALWTPGAPRWARRFLPLGRCFGLAGCFLGVAAHDLLDTYREGTPDLDTHEREGKEG